MEKCEIAAQIDRTYLDNPLSLFYWERSVFFELCTVGSLHSNSPTGIGNFRCFTFWDLDLGFRRGGFEIFTE